MPKTFLIVFASAAMGALIMVKNDQQFVILLQGKLFRIGKDTSAADKLYRKHCSKLEFWLFVVGFGLLGCAIILLTERYAAYWVPGVFGLILAGWAVWGRAKSFLAADREIDQK
jgi:hypothetical protein